MDKSKKKNKKTRIAVDPQPVCREELTGIGRVTKELVCGLKNISDFELAVQGTVRSVPVRETLCRHLSVLDEASFHIYRLPSRVMFALYTVFPPLYRLLFKRSDVFISFNYMLPRGVCGKKMVFVHDMVVKRFPETMEPVMRRVLSATIKSNCRRADRILTISEFSKSEICEILPISPEKVRVIPLAIDKEAFHPNYPASEIQTACVQYGIDGEYLLYVGTLEPRKNIVRLIEAYGQLCQRRADVPKLVIGGKKGWLYDEIFTRLQELKLTDRVIFTGFLPDKHLPLLMSGARAFLFPSLYEGFGLPPLEAMACGTPVLCCNAASLPEVVGDAAVMVDPFDTDEIADGMERLITDDALCAELREKGLGRAAQFDWSVSVRRLEEEIRGLLC